MIFLCQNMLHLADGLARHQFVECRLVVPGSAQASDENSDTEDSEAGRHGCGDAWNRLDSFFPGSQFQTGNQEDVKFDELLAKEGDENLDQCQEQDPAYAAEENFGRDEC